METLERLRLGVRQGNFVVYEFSQEDGAFAWDGDLAKLLSIKEDELPNNQETFLSLMHEDDTEEYLELIEKVVAERGSFRHEYRLKTSKGNHVWMEDTGMVMDENGESHVVGIIRPIMNQQSAHFPEGEYHYNPSFVKHLDDAIKQCVEDGTHGSFVKISINNLPTVISWYGNEVANNVIDEVVEKIRDLVSPTDIVGRIYIDQMGIVFKDISKDEVKGAVRKIYDFVRNYKSTIIEDPVSFKISFGGVNFPSNAINAEEAINRAFIALSTSRDTSNSLFYCDYTDAEATQSYSKDQISMMHYMRKAVHQDRLRLAFQPIIETHTGKVPLYECLLRIIGDGGKVSSAGAVIPIAEKMGFIDVIDQFVLEKVVEELKIYKDINISFNVSNMTTDNPKWLAMCTRLLADNEEVASRIVVEITETAAQRDLRQTAYFVAALQALGCRVALDDFGAGYTSFRQLKSLSVDIVKIDGAFVNDLAENSENLLFIKTLLDFNNCYGLKTVAECVETGEVAKVLMDIDIDYMQGYYFGMPTVERPWLDEEK